MSSKNSTGSRSSLEQCIAEKLSKRGSRQSTISDFSVFKLNPAFQSNESLTQEGQVDERDENYIKDGGEPYQNNEDGQPSAVHLEDLQRIEKISPNSDVRSKQIEEVAEFRRPEITPAAEELNAGSPYFKPIQNDINVDIKPLISQQDASADEGVIRTSDSKLVEEDKNLSEE